MNKTFIKIPQRIISVVPSITELLYDLDLEDEVIAITKFCVHPSVWFSTKTRIGGTKNINLEKIISLKPDIVIANKEENVKEQIEALQKITQVCITDVKNFDDAINMISDVGKIVSRQAKSRALIEDIQKKFSQLENAHQNKIPAAYLIWRKPYMAAGDDTFINDMMKYCGLKNIFENELRYPEINIDQLQNAGCKVLLLSSEPFPFKQKHIDELQPFLPNTKIILADGEMFSWYGSRLLYAPEYFRQLRKTIDDHIYFS
jgi:ABC-type Fe3+-hydroxamate transport system substrate-binding protein